MPSPRVPLHGPGKKKILAGMTVKEYSKKLQYEKKDSENSDSTIDDNRCYAIVEVTKCSNIMSNNNNNHNNSNNESKNKSRAITVKKEI